MTYAEICRRNAWVAFAGSILGINEHPGTTQGRASKKSPEEIAALADHMLDLYDRKFPAVED